jgi:hypothetical protein
MNGRGAKEEEAMSRSRSDKKEEERVNHGKRETRRKNE